MVLIDIITNNLLLDIIWDIFKSLGGGGGIQNEMVNYFIGTFSFFVLICIAYSQRSSEYFNKYRENLLFWGFSFGLIRNLFMFCVSIMSYLLTVDHVKCKSLVDGLTVYIEVFKTNNDFLTLLSIFPPIEHFLGVTSIIIISMAFTYYLMGKPKKEYHRKKYYICSCIITFILFIVTSYNWFMLVNPYYGIGFNIRFGSTVYDYIWHIFGILVLLYPAYLIIKEPRNWLTTIILVLFGMYITCDVLKIIDIFTLEKYEIIIAPIRHMLLNITPSLMCWVYIKENKIRLEEQTNASKILTDMQDLFILGANHEIASPLLEMDSYLSLLKMKWDYILEKEKKLNLTSNCTRGKICETIPETLDKLKSSSNDIRKILLTMKDYGHTRDFNDVKEYNIRDLTNKCISSIMFQDTTKRIPRENFNYNCESFTYKDYLVCVSPYKYRQIIENLVSNAVRAIKAKYDNYADAVISIKLKCDDDNCVLTIEDNGIGMTEEEISKCRDKRYTTFEEGTGLGLYFIDKYINEFHGTMKIESIKGKWSKITLTFPTMSIIEAI